MRGPPMELLWEITGWAGAAAMLCAYMTVSMGWIKPGSTFQAVNLFGSCAFIINGTLHGAWPSVVTNVAWFLISAVALLRMRSRTEAAVVETEPIIAPALVTMDLVTMDPGTSDTFARDAVVRETAVRETCMTDTGTHMVVPRPSPAVNCA
ncbi:hypothetical protein ABIA52_004031 [Paenarthrobacter histidinolovorans]|uniref:CBU-0592-like domain-containing protein n=2 Tax=Paenarthrobacter histidinolovorans TaxID=43664 RepID=A0ABW8NC20_9MICC